MYANTSLQYILLALAVAVFTPEAYSVVIAEELEQQTGKTVTTGAVHAALQRLEKQRACLFANGRSYFGKRRQKEAHFYGDSSR